MFTGLRNHDYTLYRKNYFIYSPSQVEVKNNVSHSIPNFNARGSVKVLPDSGYLGKKNERDTGYLGGN